MKRVVIFLVGGLVGLIFPARGQSALTGPQGVASVYIENFSTKSSTTQTCVSDVMQDRRGRLWVATCPVMAGVNSVRLYQFDGYEFYPVNLANDSLPDRTMAILKQITPDGELLGFFESDNVNAVFFFDPERQTTRTIAFDAREEGTVRDVLLVADGTSLVALQKRDSMVLEQISVHGRKTRLAAWYSPPLAAVDPDKYRNTAAIYRKGDEVLVGNGFPPQFHSLSLRDGSVRQITLNGLAHSDFIVPIKDIFVNDFYAQRILDGPGGDLFCFFPDAEQQVYIRPSGAVTFQPLNDIPAGFRVCRMEKDSAGNLLLLFVNKQSVYGGILFDIHGRRHDYSDFVAGFTKIYNVHSVNFFQSIFVCSEEGLSLKMIRQENALKYMLPGYSIRGMLETRPGDFFITSQNKPPVLYRAATGTISELPADDPLIQAWGDASVKKFSLAPDGSVWSFRRENLVHFFPQTGAHLDYTDFPPAWSQTFLSDGRVAVCSQSEGLQFFNPATGKKTGVKTGSRLSSFKGVVHDICQAPDGRLWIATGTGLWRYDPVSGDEKLFGFEPPFRDFRFMCIEAAPDGRLWLGTFLEGVYIFDPRKGTLRAIGKNQGLLNNTVVTITRDANGDFWAGTYGGLSHLSPNGDVIANFLKQDGLFELEFNRYGALRAQSGALLLGTVNGLHIIQPELLEQQRKASRAPGIYLTSITVADPHSDAEIVLKTALENISQLVLPAGRRHLRVEFALTSYIQPERNQFAYMLEGVDKNWTAIGARRELNFNDLPAGRYNLLIKGCDFQGNCTAAWVRIPIHAREYFYKEPWFYALCLLPFLVFGWVWLRRLQGERARLEKQVQSRTRQIQQDKALIEKQAQDLRRLDEAKSRFFTNISHELRTPVTLITAPVERLLQKIPAGPDNEEQRLSLQWVLYNGRKLAALVEELLELSRLEAGKTELLEIPTAFFPWCRQLFSTFGSQAEIKSIRYVLDYSASPDLQVAMDRMRLEKIINNLISNALKFTAAGGEVCLKVSENPAPDADHTTLRIQVADTGRGVPPEDLPHLFERYFQTTRSDIAREGGTGIGLALARELALLMKGDLEVESAWGKGSVFTLTLSLKKAAAAAPPSTEKTELPALPVEEAPAPPQDKGDSTGKEHLFVVEDNPDMRALIKSLLSDQYALHFANDGQEAWDLLNQPGKPPTQISLILSDVMMPRMDGYELLEKIKSHPQWRQVPMILLTARAEQEDKIQALRLGVDDYLVKPFSPAELSARVSNLIANYRGRQPFTAARAPDLQFDEVEARDVNWLKTIEAAAKTALDKALPLQVADLAEAGAMSERQFFREIKRLTGLTPNQYILEVRLQKARHLLQHRAYGTLAEVAYAVGFETPTYFTKVFETHFGKHPSAYFHAATAPE